MWTTSIHGNFRPTGRPTGQPTGLDKIRSSDWSKVGMLYCQGGHLGRWVRQEEICCSGKIRQIREDRAELYHTRTLFWQYTWVHTTSCMGSMFYYRSKAKSRWQKTYTDRYKDILTTAGLRAALVKTRAQKIKFGWMISLFKRRHGFIIFYQGSGYCETFDTFFF